MLNVTSMFHGFALHRYESFMSCPCVFGDLFVAIFVRMLAVGLRPVRVHFVC